MSFQNHFATEIDSGLNRWDVNIRVACSDQHRMGVCACHRGDDSCDCGEDQETKVNNQLFHNSCLLVLLVP